MTYLTRILALALLVLGIVEQAQAGCPTCCNSVVMGQALVTRSYRVQPGFCAQQLVCMVASCVPAPGPGCESYGIPPIYAAGNWVMVRHTPEGQEQVAKFLEELGAYKPPAPPAVASRTLDSPAR